MPRLSANVLPKYREHKGTGQAVVFLGGKDIYLGKHDTGESKSRYNQLIAAWLSAGRPSNPVVLVPEARPITLIEVFAHFKRFAKSHYIRDGEPTGAADNFQATYRVFRADYGRQPAVELGPKALKAVIEVLIAQKQSRRFICERIHQIRRIFKWAASEELIPFAVYQQLTTVEPPRKGSGKARECPPVLPVADSIVEQTLPHLPRIVADMVRLQRLSGARPAEICQLRPCDIDTTREPWRYEPSHHKTEHHGKQRVIIFGPKEREILRKYLARDPDAFCFSPRESEKSRRREMHKARVTPLHQGHRPGTNRKRKPKRTAGDRYDTYAYRRAIHRACELAFAMPKELLQPRGERAKLETAEQKAVRLKAAKKWREVHTWAPNRLRHAAATELRREHGSEISQIVMGHSRLNTTEIYAERDLKRLEAIKEGVGVSAACAPAAVIAIA